MGSNHENIDIFNLVTFVMPLLCTVIYCNIGLKVCLLYQLFLVFMYIFDAIEGLKKNIDKYALIYRVKFTYLLSTHFRASMTIS
jgi:hypothetical protein